MNDDEEYYEPTEPRNYPTIGQAISLALWLLIIPGVFGFVMSLIPTKINPAHNKTLDAIIELISYLLIMAATIWIGFSKFRKNEEAKLRLKFNKVQVIPVLIAVFMILTMPVLTDPVNILFPMTDDWKKIFAEMDDNNIFAILGAVVAAPILEEIFFRGIILNGLLKNYSPQTAIIVSAAIFGIIHLNPWQAIPAFMIGLIIGWMYWKTNSIIPGILLHFFNNAFSVVLGMLFPNIDTLKQILSTPLYIALFLGCAAILFGGWIFLEKYFEDNPTPEDEEEYETELITEE